VENETVVDGSLPHVGGSGCRRCDTTSTARSFHFTGATSGGPARDGSNGLVERHQENRQAGNRANRAIISSTLCGPRGARQRGAFRSAGGDA